MSLVAWQRALVAKVQGRAPLAADAAELGAKERTWIDALDGTSGLAATRSIQAWWRTQRLCTAAPLTLGMLGADTEATVQRYLAEEPVSTLFFHEEAERFLSWLQRCESSPVVAIAAWERALRRAAAFPEEPPQTIALGADPDAVLRHLLLGAPAAAWADEGWEVTVDPALPSRWRVSRRPGERVPGPQRRAEPRAAAAG